MIQGVQISFRIATNHSEFDDAKALFQEYANSLQIDLAYQDFSKELKSIDIQYNEPRGLLILAYDNGKAVGCAGVRKFDNKIAELKRMFVKEDYRGHKIAQQMLTMAIAKAKEFGYRKIRLDTIPSMKQAQSLYRANGFYEISSYRFSPVEGTIFMEKSLLDEYEKSSDNV